MRYYLIIHNGFLASRRQSKHTLIRCNHFACTPLLHSSISHSKQPLSSNIQFSKFYCCYQVFVIPLCTQWRHTQEGFYHCECLIAPVTLGSDYRTILKSDLILRILKSELDVPILKIEKFAVTLVRLIGTDFIARKTCQWFVLRLSCDVREIIARHLYDIRTMIARW